MAPADLDVVETVQPAEQFSIDERLHEAVALGPAETRVGRGHFGEHPTLGVDESQDLVGHRVRQDAIDQSDRLESTQRLVVKPHPAGIIDQRCRVPR